MRLQRAAVLALAAWCPAFCALASETPAPKGWAVVHRGAKPAKFRAAISPSFPPIQVEVRTPFAPTLFPADGRKYLVYELSVQNFSGDALDLRGLQVVDADHSTQEPIASFDAEQLLALLHPTGVGEAGHAQHLEANQGAVVFLCLAFDGGDTAPARLRHLLLLDGAVAVGPAIGTQHTALRSLAPAVSGSNWTAADGPSIDSHHRVGIFIADGLAQLSRRFAVDWKKLKDGVSFSGDARDVQSYYAYGEPVFSVANATVVVAQDGFPNNIPRTAAGFRTAVPITMESVAGNTIVLDLGDGQFATYAHLQPGSVLAKAGDRVKRGQLLGRIGNSGDSREPHLHFQVTTGSDLLASEGVPYLINRFRMKPASGNWETRLGEFPMGQTTVFDFGPARGTAPPTPPRDRGSTTE